MWDHRLQSAGKIRHDLPRCTFSQNYIINSCRQAHIKLEVVYFMYLWSIDMEAVLVAMSCFSLLCEEADIR